MKLSELSVLAFTERVASCDPAPGGGSCAALYGCLGAALTAMVSGMTQNRKKYAEYEEHVKEVEAKCEKLREKLADVMERDTDAFLLVSDAYALPKATDEEKAARSLAIQEGLKACTRTPLEMMELMGEAVELISSMLDGFNTSCASDLGVAALSLKAGILGAWLNIKINTGSLKDKAFAADAEARGQAVLDRAVPVADDCFARLLKMVEG